MSKKKPERVRDWPKVTVRVDPETGKNFKEKLKENGDDQSKVIRRAIRDYTKD